MAALLRCLGSLALLAGGAAGVRVSKRREQSANTKFIAGVPVLNYHLAYVGFPGELSAAKEEEWVVLVKPNVTNGQIKKMCKKARRGCNLWGNPSQGGVPFFEMRGTEKDLAAIIKIGRGAVKSIEPDSDVYAIPELEADDVEAGLWGLERVAAYSRASQGAGVTVFVLDTGVRTTHQDFGGRGIPHLDMTSGSPIECNGALDCAADNQGHGTHCAGTAVGTTYGVAPAATVRGVKVLGDSAGGRWSWIYEALDFLAVSSIRPAVASMSVGHSGTGQAMQDAIDAATGAGLTVVVAAGNTNSDACSFSPAFVPSAITVGSTDSQNRRSSFSNYGACTNIWAPGSSILSAGHGSDTSTKTYSGTSMACPHVAGGAALVLENNPSFTRDQVLTRLHADATRYAIGDLNYNDINIMLYVGSDAPPPQGGLAPTPAPPAPPTPQPTPAPPTPPPICPSDTSIGPDAEGHCKCKGSLKYRCFKAGVRGNCPVTWSTRGSSLWYHKSCDDCICKSPE